ncbi:MAG: hypothetical protein ABJB66_20175 [Gemmatimonadaceae bacterium]
MTPSTVIDEFISTTSPCILGRALNAFEMKNASESVANSESIQRGVPFRFERDMLQPLACGVYDALGLQSDRLQILREPMFGGVIPDLLIGIVPDDFTVAVCHNDFPQGLVDSFLVHFLTDCGTSEIAELQEQLGLNATSTARSLKKLHHAGLVDWTYADTAVATRFAEQVLDIEIIAIEAKLTRWREALEQATAYKTFCDRAFVAMDANQFVLTPDCEKNFTENRVGLIVCDGDRIEQLIHAPSGNERNPQRARAALRVAASCTGLRVGRSWCE